MRQDLLPASVSAVVGGPLGRRASGRASSLAHLLPLVTAMTAIPLVLGVARQGHCVAKGWGGEEQFWRGCFSDLTAQYQIAGLDRGPGAWLQGEVPLEPLPVLSGAMSVLASLVPDGSWLTQTRWYFVLWALLVAVLAMSCVLAVGLTRPHRVDLATQLALSPVWVVAAYLSPDLLAVALVLWAMWSWEHGRPRAAGVLVGVGLLAHVWVLAVLLALVGTAVVQRRRPELRRALLPAGGVVLLLGGGSALLAPGVWRRPLEALTAGGSGYGSPWHVPALLGHPLPVWAVLLLVGLGWVAATALGLWFLTSAWRTPTWAQLSAFVVPVVAITSRATPVQAALWVVPLAILAGVSWRTHLGLVAVEVVHASALWLYIGGLSDPAKGLPAAWYVVITLGRALTWAFLMWSVWYTPNDLRGERRGPPPGQPAAPVTPSPERSSGPRALPAR